MSYERSRDPSGERSYDTKKVLLLIGGVIVLVAAVIAVTVAVFFKKNPEGTPVIIDESGSVSTVDITVPVKEDSYDKDANQLVEEEYTTILHETQDAGKEYVENTLFVGDSNTYRYMNYGYTDLTNDIGVVGMGIQDVTGIACVRFVGYSSDVTIPEAVSIMQPRRIIIGFGTNNADTDASVDNFIQQYVRALDAIESAYPYADIIINAVPPLARDHQNASLSMTTIDKFNQALADLAEDRGCYFLNSSSALKDSTTGFARDGYTIEDGYHLSEPGVKALFDYIRTHALETEDRRPALSPVPRRNEPEPYIIDGGIPHRGSVAGSGTGTSSDSASEKAEGMEIVFVCNDDKMGALTGETEQIIMPGETCSAVQAVAAEGYQFSYWSCTEGRISDVSAAELVFTTPNWLTEEDTVIVTANFIKISECTVTLNCIGTDRTTLTGFAWLAESPDDPDQILQTTVRQGTQLFICLAGSTGDYKLAAIADGNNNPLSVNTPFTVQSDMLITVLFEKTGAESGSESTPESGSESTSESASESTSESSSESISESASESATESP